MNNKNKQNRENWIILGFTIVLMLFFTSCKESDHELIPAPGEKTGFIQLKDIISATIDIQSENQNGRTKNSSISTNNWRVFIFSENGDLILEYDDRVQIPTVVELLEGRYFVEVHSDNLVSAAFDTPYFEGASDPFDVVDADTTEVIITAYPANFRIKVEYTESTVNDFDKIYSIVSTSKGSLTYSRTQDRFGYFELDDKVDVKAYLFYTTTDGQENLRIVSGEILNPKAADSYTVTIDGSIRSGAFNIDINVIENFDEDSVTFDDPIDPLLSFVPGELYIDPRDTEEYETIVIDLENGQKQVWIAENFRYRGLSGIVGGGVYGAYYTYQQAIDAAPQRARLATLEDYQNLIDYLGGSDYLGRLRVGGDIGLNLLPGGELFRGNYSGVGSNGFYWCDGGDSPTIVTFGPTSSELNIRSYPNDRQLTVRYIIEINN
ncbi:MAG: DUF4493 domain-containing protein [Bacteroidota bacterium]